MWRNKGDSAKKPQKNNSQYLLTKYMKSVLCRVAVRQSYRGADKSLARPGRKQATATKLLTFESHSKKKKIRKVVRPTRSPRQQWPPLRTKNGNFSIVFSVGSGYGLISTPVYIGCMLPGAMTLEIVKYTANMLNTVPDDADGKWLRQCWWQYRSQPACSIPMSV